MRVDSTTVGLCGVCGLLVNGLHESTYVIVDSRAFNQVKAARAVLPRGSAVNRTHH